MSGGERTAETVEWAFHGGNLAFCISRETNILTRVEMTFASTGHLLCKVDITLRRDSTSVEWVEPLPKIQITYSTNEGDYERPA